MLVKYHKIKAPFLWSMETKKLTHEFALKEFEYLKDLQWCWTEKIDGTNIRIYWNGIDLLLRGRDDNSQIPAEFVEYYLKTFVSSGLDKIIEQEFGDKEVIFFGEGYGGKIQGNGGYGNTSFILFDIMVNGRYLTRDKVLYYANLFGLDIVPIMLTGTIDEAIAYVKEEPQSNIGNIALEGLVGTPICPMLTSSGERIITKVKVRDFKNWE